MEFPTVSRSGIVPCVASRRVSFFEFAVAAFFTTLIFLLIVTFAVRYRAGRRSTGPTRRPHSKILEVFWIGVPCDLAG